MGATTLGSEHSQRPVIHRLFVGKLEFLTSAIGRSETVARKLTEGLLHVA